MKKLFRLGLFAAVVAGVMRLISSQKSEWQGLSEAEVRAKLHTKLDSRMPTDKVDQIGDKVVEQMRRRRVLGDEEVGSPV